VFIHKKWFATQTNNLKQYQKQVLTEKVAKLSQQVMEKQTLQQKSSKKIKDN